MVSISSMRWKTVRPSQTKVLGAYLIYNITL